MTQRASICLLENVYSPDHDHDVSKSVVIMLVIETDMQEAKKLAQAYFLSKKLAPKTLKMS